MWLRVFGCVVVSFTLCALAVDAGGGKKANDKEMKKDNKKDDKNDTKKDHKKDDKRDFNEKDALHGVIKSVDRKEKSFTALMTISKRERTFGITKNTQFFGPRGGDRDDTGIDDECMAPGYEIKVVPTKDGRNAAAIQFDVHKKDAKKDEKKKAA